MVRSALPLGSAKNVYWFLVKGSGLTGCCVKIFQFVVAPTSYLFHLTSVISRLPSSLSNPKVIRAYSKDIFTSPVGEKNFSRGGAKFYLH